MIQCSVLGRAYTLNGHLRKGNAMHDITSTSDLAQDTLMEIFDQEGPARHDIAEITAAECDLLYVQGLGDNHRMGLSVMNSEYIAFHPHQCLPKYEIVYEIP